MGEVLDDFLTLEDGVLHASVFDVEGLLVESAVHDKYN